MLKKKNDEKEKAKKSKAKTPMSGTEQALSDNKSVTSMRSVKGKDLKNILKRNAAESPAKPGAPGAPKPEEPKEKEKELTLKEIFMYNFQ